MICLILIKSNKGQSLGPLGINMMHFCKDFNANTTTIRPETPMRVIIRVLEDRSYNYDIKPPETSWFIKRVLGKQKLSKMANHQIVDDISLKYIYEIAKTK